jgi:hypothetical protein
VVGGGLSSMTTRRRACSSMARLRGQFPGRNASPSRSENGLIHVAGDVQASG